MERPIVHPNFAKCLNKKTASQTASSSISSSTAATSTSQTTAGGVSYASTIQYDHETYLELLAGRSSHVEKTASQIYKEERARQLSLRAQDPAVLSGPSDLDVDIFQDSIRY